MLALVFYILIIYFVFKYIIKIAASTYDLLNKVLAMQEFSNISTVYSTSTLVIIRADNHGENYLFGVRKDGYSFSVQDIEKLYSIAQNLHIHLVIIATKTSISSTNSIYRKIREYGIDVWNEEKLKSLASEASSATSSHSFSVLKTSDTSDDTCEIDSNSFDPIQDEYKVKTHNLFSGLFSKPDHL